MVKKRLYTIDNIKFILAIFVVAIHINSFFFKNKTDFEYSKFNDILMYTTRIAVPFFLITQGYFFAFKRNLNSIYKMISMYFIIYVVIYLVSYFGLLLFGINTISHNFYIKWYFIHTSLFMLLSLNKNKYLDLSLLILTLIINLNFHIEDDSIRRFFMYAYMFYFGVVYNSWGLKIKTSNITNYVFLILILIFQIFYNPILGYNQNTLVEFSLALILFIVSLNMKQKKIIFISNPANNLNIFLYHTVFINIFLTAFKKSEYLQNIYNNNNNLYLLIYLFLVVVFALIFGKLMQFIDKKIFKGFIYG